MSIKDAGAAELQWDRGEPGPKIVVKQVRKMIDETGIFL